MKTIKMPKKIADKWLAALRSGEYKQCTNVLYNGGGYCCLGVLQMVVDGKVEVDKDDGTPEPLPSFGWLAKKGIEFLSIKDGSLVHDRVPLLPALQRLAATANDSGESFATIADAIEQCVEYTD